MEKKLTKRQIAVKVRKFLEKHAEILCDGSDDELSCMCAIASTALAFFFTKYGYKVQVWAGIAIDGTWINHCWCVSNSKIWDITATQFGDYPKVYVTSLDDKDYEPYKRISDIRCLHTWPREQKPLADKMRFIYQGINL